MWPHVSVCAVCVSVGFHALEDLTGMPSTVLHLKDMDATAAFDEILEADR